MLRSFSMSIVPSTEDRGGYEFVVTSNTWEGQQCKPGPTLLEGHLDRPALPVMEEDLRAAAFDAFSLALLALYTYPEVPDGASISKTYAQPSGAKEKPLYLG